MKNILNRQLLFIPILYIIAKLLWGIIPLNNLDETLKMAMNDLFGPLALMVIIFLTCIYIFWRLPGFSFLSRFLFGTKCNIHGTWQGQLRYEKNGQEAEKTVYLVIKQTDGYSISIWLFTDERSSSSVFADIISYKGGQRICYSYEVEDSSRNKKVNPLHNGFCQLDIGTNVNILKGMYHTSRKTSGELFFDKRNKKTVIDYNSAQKLFEI